MKPFSGASGAMGAIVGIVVATAGIVWLTVTVAGAAVIVIL
ncbi:MAG: hypothetical protein ACLPVY_27610 [Acidimicrobiia bacterium]